MSDYQKKKLNGNINILEVRLCGNEMSVFKYIYRQMIILSFVAIPMPPTLPNTIPV